MNPKNLFCGTAGWSYAHWNGVVYPRPKPRSFHPLEFMAGLFDTVEVNTTFYGFLRPEVSRLWLQKVAENPRFRFTAKLNRRFTHDRVLDPAEIAAFKEGLWPLANADKLGCVLMQFPWSFKFNSENREHFLAVRRAFREFPLVAEFRHSSWMRDEALGTLIDYRVGFCNIDQPVHEKAMPATAFLTSPIAYVRLHGRNPNNWFADYGSKAMVAQSYDYSYSRPELEEWKERIEHVGSLADATYVSFNNDAGGKAVFNAMEMQQMMDSSKLVRMPVVQQRQPDLFSEVAA